jgi:hypothetical protein
VGVEKSSSALLEKSSTLVQPFTSPQISGVAEICFLVRKSGTPDWRWGEVECSEGEGERKAP